MNAAITSKSPQAELPSLTPTDPIGRNGVVQAVLKLFDEPDYLEIGVNQGKTFNSLVARTKVAVDPKFLFAHEEVAEREPGTTFWQTTSDDYFGRIASDDTAFDVIYLDGLHTSEQTIRDLINAICFLKRGGVIIIDDVFPCSYEASLPERSDTRIIRKVRADSVGAWMGDVFRLVFFVETFCQQFSYSTVNNNHGQLLMWREPRPVLPHRTLSSVGAKEYKDLFLESDSFRSAPLGVILNKIQSVRGNP